MTNHLKDETSPYLHQHADNPVDWYPWNEQTLALAKRENKPILVSIGYAACHWCHVMAHESFEDKDTAELMNKLFINIKVDREERPDLDQVFQTAHYILSQRGGGWPLTIFLTPDDLTPFYSGTYFPKTQRYQLPALSDVLQTIADLYHQHPADIKKQNQELQRILNPQARASTIAEINAQPITTALNTLQASYDNENGGFGHAPKFPQVPKLAFLLQLQPELCVKTLAHMLAGGINDQLGGGFFRYSVDAKWIVPHFEKMLYDNAQLLQLYAQAKTYNLEFATCANSIADWIIQYMQSPEGGYYSSIDADTVEGEGKYYLWDKSEIESLLSPGEFAIVEPYFGLDLPPNVEGEWHLYVAKHLANIAADQKINLTEAESLLATAKNKLLTARNKRKLPGLDNKILTAWNALLIKAMFIAGVALDEPRYIDSAEKALQFLIKHAFQNQELFAVHAQARTRFPAYLDDYAFLLDALLHALQIKWRDDYLQLAIQLANELIAKFFDEEYFGFYFTAHDHEKLLFRPKTMMDEAMPSGNAVAVNALLTLGYLIGETKYLDVAEKTLQAAMLALTRYPAEHCGMLLALKSYFSPQSIVIIRGTDNELMTWQKLARANDNLVFAIPTDAKNLPSALSQKKPIDKICAYICEGMQCKNVITSLHDFEQMVE